jgi:hypothetical protein
MDNKRQAFLQERVKKNEGLTILVSGGIDYLCNVIRIVTETGLRIYKEPTPMKKDQLDLERDGVDSGFKNAQGRG